MVVQTHEPIDRGEGERNGEERETGKGDLAVDQGVTGRAGGVLMDRVGP